MINFIGYILFFFTRSKRFKSAQVLSFLNAMVTLRLMVTISERADMKELLMQNKLAFGCLDTWLIYKLSGGNFILTEPSNASTTGLYDPFVMDWGYSLLSFISFPTTLLPAIGYSAGRNLATIDNTIFDIELNIGAMVGDQQAAAFANGCWETGEVNISLGTGSFVCINTGTSPHASLKGLYPVVGWKFPGIHSFFAEGCCHDTGSVIEWCKSIDLFENISETSEIAALSTDSDVFFIPAFNGMQTPVNDPMACCAFFGLKSTTSKAQLVRSVLQSIAFRIYQIWKTILVEIDFKISDTLRACGGVSSNDFICQSISTLTNRPVERMKNECFSSAKGAGMMAGLSIGLWSMDDLRNIFEVDRRFAPNSIERASLLEKFEKWENALKRCLNFYAQ